MQGTSSTMLDSRVVDQIAKESRDAHARHRERTLLGAADTVVTDLATELVAEFVAETLARPYNADATYAVSGSRLNRVTSDLLRGAAQLDAAAQYLAVRGRDQLAAQLTAHATRMRQTSALLVAQAALLTPARIEDVA